MLEHINDRKVCFKWRTVINFMQKVFNFNVKQDWFQPGLASAWLSHSLSEWRDHGLNIGHVITKTKNLREVAYQRSVYWLATVKVCRLNLGTSNFFLLSYTNAFYQSFIGRLHLLHLKSTSALVKPSHPSQGYGLTWQIHLRKFSILF